MRYWLVMPAAGAGRRFGGDVPKQYAELCGLPVIERALQPFIGDPRCAEALDHLESRQLPGGGWPADGRYSRRTRQASGLAEAVGWGQVSAGRMNEWVTVAALAVLRAAGRWRPEA